MRHWKARRLLAALPDGTLPVRVAEEVRAHADGCARCRRQLRELERCEELVRSMPTRLFPLESPAATYTRLAALTRWSPEPELADPEGWRLPALGFAGLLAAFAVLLSVGSWSPVVGDQPQGLQVSALVEDSSVVPQGWRNPR